MAIIQGTAGQSLTDIFDVRGSRVSIDELLVEQGIAIVYDLSSTIVSERLASTVRRISDSISGEDNFDQTIEGLPNISRILGVTVLVSAASQIQHVQLSTVDPGASSDTDAVFWSWDNSSDTEEQIRISNAGSVGNLLHLRPAHQSVWLPNFAFGLGQPAANRRSQLAMRGRTLAGASVDITAIIQLAFVAQPGLSSYGVNVPSW